MLERMERHALLVSTLAAGGADPEALKSLPDMPQELNDWLLTEPDVPTEKSDLMRALGVA